MASILLTLQEVRDLKRLCSDPFMELGMTLRPKHLEIGKKLQMVKRQGRDLFPQGQQARNFSMLLDDIDEKCRYVIHDRDNSFSGFDFILKAQGIKIVKTPPKAPMCNAFAERFVREARQTLNQIIPLGQWHFRHALKSIEQHHIFSKIMMNFQLLRYG